MDNATHLTCRVAGPAVALESAVLTSGLPEDARPAAVERMAAAVTAHDVEPAFTGVIAGQPTVGLTPDELELLAAQDRKLSTRDLPAATGGIGGVHPAPGGRDVSADLYELARTPIVLVCSGAKAIVDLRATLERLETLGVTLLGYQTHELPAFYSAESGLQLGLSVERPEEVAEIWRESRALGSPGALLVCVPPPPDVALSRKESEAAVSRALSDLDMAGISGPGVTPFMLRRIADHTGGRSLEANLGLLENNAAVAAAIVRLL